MPPQGAVILGRANPLAYGLTFGLLIAAAVVGCVHVMSIGPLAILEAAQSGSRSAQKTLAFAVSCVAVLFLCLRPMVRLATGRTAAIWIADNRLFWKQGGLISLPLDEIVDVEARGEMSVNITPRVGRIRRIAVSAIHESGKDVAEAIRAAAKARRTAMAEVDPALASAILTLP